MCTTKPASRQQQSSCVGTGERGAVVAPAGGGQQPAGTGAREPGVLAAWLGSNSCCVGLLQLLTPGETAGTPPGNQKDTDFPAMVPV